MPVTDFQREVLTLLKAHRNPNSYVAGGIAIHRSELSLRRSNDVDFFHDTEVAVSESATADIKVLSKNGYKVTLLLDQPSFIRAITSKNDFSLKLEWVRDTAFRFFPIVEDEDLGFRLHDIDLAVNKCLALANRNEVRDILDLIQMHSTVISLAAICWATCGKDPGFSPDLLIDCMQRHSIIRPEKLSAESLVKDISPTELKKRWLDILNPVSALLREFPSADLGCIYTNNDGSIVREPSSKNLANKKRHFGSIGGSWPSVYE